jgi:hypothetical protein
MSPGACTARHAALYTALVQAFVSCMLLAVLAANLGVMWVAVEATTITTTFLVGHRRTDGALEASWKYMVICSAGIAVAFLGTALVYYAGLHAAGHPAASLDWASLLTAAPRLNPAVIRLAMALLVLGYGTKPDAQLAAGRPQPGTRPRLRADVRVLLTVAFYALLRFKAITDAALGAGYPRVLLATVGLASLAVAASLLLTQRDYKRMLAYHSIEHMGLIALGAAAGSTLAIAAVLLHILGHGLAKGVLFLACGEILLAEGTSDIAKVPALLSRRPVLGGIFGLERLFQGQDPAAAVPLAERISGDSAVAHTLAYCLAVEEACRITVPQDGARFRALLLELERLYNHVADIGALCNDVGFGLAQARALTLRERLLRLNAEVTGHRLLRGAIWPGRTLVLRLPAAAEPGEIARHLEDIIASRPPAPWSWTASRAPRYSPARTRPASARSALSPPRPGSPSTPASPTRSPIPEPHSPARGSPAGMSWPGSLSGRTRPEHRCA